MILIPLISKSCIGFISLLFSFFIFQSTESIPFYSLFQGDGLLKKQDSLILEENFEKETCWEGNSYAYQQFAEDHAFEMVNEPVFSGNKSGKFELRYGDKKATKNGGPRAEVLFPVQSHHERWYSFAVFFPAYGWKDDQDDELISQWHSGKGTPTLALRVSNGNLKLRIGHNPQIPTSQWDFYEFGAVPKDEWNEFVFHVVHSQGKDGLVEVWRNGEKLVTHKGPNWYSQSSFPRWKVGIYKSGWGKRKTNVDLRVIYFDNIRIASENADFKQLTSWTSF